MDTYTQAGKAKRQYRGLAEKLRIVEETLAGGVSVSRVARAHGVNANLVFNWRRLYQAGRLGRRGEAKLLPVRVIPESSTGMSYRGVIALEHRRKRTARTRTRSLDKKVVKKNSAVIPRTLPHIAELITYGEITVGVQHSIGCIATATDGHNCLAMLVRGQRETLIQLLTRLDRAIDKALTEDVYTDEVNS